MKKKILFLLLIFLTISVTGNEIKTKEESVLAIETFFEKGTYIKFIKSYHISIYNKQNIKSILIDGYYDNFYITICLSNASNTFFNDKNNIYLDENNNLIISSN